jgi:mono/diheme cytochrome c family protein
MRVAMRHWMVVGLLIGVPAAAQAQSGQAYYTEAQAARGQALFKKHCAACHFAEPDPEKAKKETAGFMLARVKSPSNLGGTYIAGARAPRTTGRRIYTTVYYLFRELESMPAVPDSISQQERTDILAYILKQNRYPAGRDEMKFDLAAMRRMPLDEPGFEPLFNGKDFSGLKFLVGVGCALPPEGCGRTTPGRAFAVRNGELIGTGKEHGIVFTEKKYQDFTLRLDALAEKPADWEEGEDDVYYYANAGYHTFLMPENIFIWARALTFKGELRELMDPIITTTGAGAGVAAKAKAYKWDKDVKERVTKPLGQWNSLEIVSKGGDVKAYINDTLVTTITQHEFTTPGHIAIQMQGFPMRWRNLRIREE